MKMSKNKNTQTYVVLGIFYGGTSATAGALRILGVDMGVEKNTKNHEDAVMQHAQLDMDAWKKRIQERNAEEKTWGFKHPNTVRFFDELEPYLVNPYYIAVYRDKEAIADSEEKYVGLYRKKSYARTDWWYEKMDTILQENPENSLELYYGAMTNPNQQREQAEKLYEFVKGNKPKKDNKTVQKIVDFWNSGDYTQLDKR